MMSNVVEFPRHPDFTKTRDRKEETHKRLRDADEIEAELRLPGNIRKPDRPILARNLGRIWERTFRGREAPPLSALFEAAFGKQAGEANHKKRKRFIRFDGEDLPERESEIRDGDFAAKGHLFTDIARAIKDIDIANHGKSDQDIRAARRSAILQLIEDSSFDKKVAPADRYRAEAQAELRKRLRQVTDLVEREVDLERMTEIVCHDLIYAVIDWRDGTSRIKPPQSNHRHDRLERRLQPLTGDVPRDVPYEKLSQRDRDLCDARRMLYDREDGGNQQSVWLDYEDFDVGEEWVHRWMHAYANWTFGSGDIASPRVVLGHVLTPVKPKNGVVRVKVDAGELRDEAERLSRACGSVVTSTSSDWLAGRTDTGSMLDLLVRRHAIKGLALAHGYTAHDIEKRDMRDISGLARAIEEDGNAPIDPWVKDESTRIVVRRRLEILLGGDFSSGDFLSGVQKPVPVLALAQGVAVNNPDDHEGREGDAGVKFMNGPFEPAINFGPQNSGVFSGYADSLFLCRVSDTDYVFFNLDGDGNIREEEAPFLGMSDGGIPIMSREGCAAMLEPLFAWPHDHDFSLLPFDEHRDRPCPAEAGSLANLVLKNLAYSDESERYDKLLLADARRKEEVLKAFSKARRDEYEQAISRLD